MQKDRTHMIRLLNLNFLNLQSPSFVGGPLGILQLVLYWKYRKSGIIKEPNKWDLEKNGENSKKLQLAINNDINGKS